MLKRSVDSGSIKAAAAGNISFSAMPAAPPTTATVYFFLIGEAGVGKTTALSRLVRTRVTTAKSEVFQHTTSNNILLEFREIDQRSFAELSGSLASPQLKQVAFIYVFDVTLTSSWDFVCTAFADVLRQHAKARHFFIANTRLEKTQPRRVARSDINAFLTGHQRPDELVAEIGANPHQHLGASLTTLLSRFEDVHATSRASSRIDTTNRSPANSPTSSVLGSSTSSSSPSFTPVTPSAVSPASPQHTFATAAPRKPQPATGSLQSRESLTDSASPTSKHILGQRSPLSMSDAPLGKSNSGSNALVSAAAAATAATSAAPTATPAASSAAPPSPAHHQSQQAATAVTYSGVVVLGEAGDTEVEVPRPLRSPAYTLTPLGEWSPLFIAKELTGVSFRIAGGKPAQRVSWAIRGVPGRD